MSKNINIMPMGGIGERFKKFGYVNPKPLINIKKKPMFLLSSKSLPQSNSWIFVVPYKFKHIRVFQNNLKRYFKKYKIIYLKNKTSGQAITCLKAYKYIKNNEQIFINSCDVFFKYNKNELKNKLLKNDIIVFTSKVKNIHIKNPKSFGWVKSLSNNRIKISCKKPLSRDLRKDRIIIGAFVFKNKIIFKNSINAIIKNKKKINNEYYLDVVAAEAGKLGLSVAEVRVKKIVSWGSHQELNLWKKNNERI